MLDIYVASLPAKISNAEQIITRDTARRIVMQPQSGIDQLSSWMDYVPGNLADHQRQLSWHGPRRPASP